MDPITIVLVCVICFIGVIIVFHFYVKINEKLKRKIIPLNGINIKN